MKVNGTKSEISKNAEYKINIWKSIIFLYAGNGKLGIIFQVQSEIVANHKIVTYTSSKYI